jgi:hypothetical protein
MFIFAILQLGAVCGNAQDKNQQVFAEVPSEHRTQLLKQLKLLIDYQRAQQWDKLYEMLYEPKVSKEKYVQTLIKSPPQDILLNFVPQSVTLLYPDSGWYFISGCASIKRKNKISHFKADTEARFQDGKWYLLAIGVTIPIDAKPKLCSIDLHP